MKPSAKTAKPKTPWRCPKCGREFAHRSAYHSCGNYTLEGYLAKKKPAAVALFNLLLQTAQALGPITISPGKTQISFRLNTTFMMVDVTGQKLSGYLFLNQPRPAACFRQIKAASANRHVHIFQIDDPQTIRGPFAQFLAEAIAERTEPTADAPKSPPKKEPTIGEQINQLYRASRTTSPPPP